MPQVVLTLLAVQRIGVFFYAKTAIAHHKHFNIGKESPASKRGRGFY